MWYTKSTDGGTRPDTRFCNKFSWEPQADGPYHSCCAARPRINYIRIVSKGINRTSMSDLVLSSVKLWTLIKTYMAMEGIFLPVPAYHNYSPPDDNDSLFWWRRCPSPSVRVRSTIAPFRKSVSVGATALVLPEVLKIHEQFKNV